MNRTRQLLIAGLVVLVVFFVGFLVFSGFKKSPSDLCKQMIGYINQGDASKSYKLFSTTAQQSQTQDEWRQQIASLKGKLPESSLKKIAADPNLTAKGMNTTLISYDTGHVRASCQVYKSNGGIESFSAITH